MSLLQHSLIAELRQGLDVLDDLVSLLKEIATATHGKSMHSQGTLLLASFSKVIPRLLSFSFV